MKTSFLKIQKQLLQRRLWLIAAVSVYYLLYYPVATVMLISRANERARMQALSEYRLTLQKLHTVSGWLGLRGSFLFVAALLGIVIALQGYSWLFNQEKIDFYESQPMSRKSRFFHVYVNGIMIFAVPLIVFSLTAVLAAAAMGGMSPVILLEVLYTDLRMLVMFLASYSLGIVAVMLTGSMPVAIMAALALSFFEMLAFWLVQSYAGQYFRSYYFNEPPLRMLRFSPVAAYVDAIAVTGPDKVLRAYNYRAPDTAYLSRYITLSWKMDAACIVSALILLAAGYTLYRYRKAEFAGASLVYRPVQAVFRIVISCISALIGGSLIRFIFNEGRGVTAAEDIFITLGMAFICLSVSCVMQSIITFNIRKAFEKLWQPAAAFAIALFVYAMFRFDLGGYDRFIPKQEKVESVMLCAYTENDGFLYPSQAVTDDEGGFYYIDYSSEEDYAEENMFLPFTPQLASVMEKSMQAIRQEGMSVGTAEADTQDGWYAVVKYRMKNGRTIARRVKIPSDVPEQDMDAVTGTPEYRNGIIPICLGDYPQESLKSAELSFTNYANEKRGDAELYHMFAEAYRKDLEHYCYSMAAKEDSVGTVWLRWLNAGGWMESGYKVYESYTNTIEFLKANDLYLKPIDSDDVQYISVERWNEEIMNTVSAQFSGKDQIREILESSVPSGSAWAWKKNSSFDNETSGTVWLNQKDKEDVSKSAPAPGPARGYYDPDSGRVLYIQFLSGRIPDYVTRELQKAEQNFGDR